jgi:hypothetical protein
MRRNWLVMSTALLCLICCGPLAAQNRPDGPGEDLADKHTTFPSVASSGEPVRNSSNVIVNFVTTTSTPLNPGFNGFNSNLKNAVEYYDTNFQHILTTLSPGWLRFPGGTDSEAFDWASGEIVSAWVNALAADSYQQGINAAAQPIVAGREARCLVTSRKWPPGSVARK